MATLHSKVVKTVKECHMKGAYDRLVEKYGKKMADAQIARMLKIEEK